MKRGREFPFSWSFFQGVFMFSTLKKMVYYVRWNLRRRWRRIAWENAGLGQLSSDALSSIATVVQSKLSWSWWPFQAGAMSIPIGIVVLVLLASLTDFLSSGHSCLPSRERGLHGDYGELVSKAGLIAPVAVFSGWLHADGSGICFFRCRCHHVSDSVSSSL